MKILFTTPIFEYPTTHGPSLRITNTLIALSRVAEVHLLLLSDTQSDKKNVKKFADINNIRLVSNPLTKLHNIGLVKLKSVLEAFYINLIMRHIKSNTIWFGYGCMTVQLIKECRNLNQKMIAISDTDSVQSRYFLRKLPYLDNNLDYNIALNTGKTIEKGEQELVKLSSAVIAVSEVDQKYYMTLSQSAGKIALLYNAIDVKKYKKTKDPGLKHPAIILTGWYGKGSPMEDGANWLINNIWQSVIKQFPEAQLYLVGKGSLSTMGKKLGDNIHNLGEVVDMIPYLTNADVAVVPLRFESGTRFKILEASASMVPVVSTTLGAEGLKLEDGTHLLIADKPVDFAKGIIRLLKNESLRKSLAYNSHAIISKKYNLETIEKQIKNIIDKYISGDS